MTRAEYETRKEFIDKFNALIKETYEANLSLKDVNNNNIIKAEPSGNFDDEIILIRGYLR